MICEHKVSNNSNAPSDHDRKKTKGKQETLSTTCGYRPRAGQPLATSLRQLTGQLCVSKIKPPAWNRRAVTVNQMRRRLAVGAPTHDKPNNEAQQRDTRKDTADDR